MLVLWLVMTGLPPAQSTRAPIDWTEIAKAYDTVRDYTAIYEKEERAIDNGELQTIRLFFREPADIRLEWLDGKGHVDQTAIYRKGFNNDKLIARRSGMLGSIIGTLQLDPRSRIAMEDSRHPITEVGIGHIIETVAHDTSASVAVSRFIAEEPLDTQPAFHFAVDATTPASIGGVDGARRADIWVDRALRLPVKLEIRDASGALLERHRFKNLRVNTGLTNASFIL